MNKYHLVSDKKVEEPSQDNEIRITKNGLIGGYISYAFKLVQDENKSWVIKAMGQTIHKAITVAEILKRRIEGLHQINELASVKVVDIYEPLEEGLDRVELTRHIPSISITLSTQQLDSHHSGYQSPLSAELFDQNKAEWGRRGQRGNRRGGSPRSDIRKDDQHESDEVEFRENGRGRGGRGRGRGRGGRGRGRGGRGRGRGGRGLDRGRGIRGDARRRGSGQERTNSNRQKRTYTQTRNPANSNNDPVE